MARLWEIREGYDAGFKGGHHSAEEAYEMGCEHGYRKAMEEVYGGHGSGYGHRDKHSRSMMGMHGDYGDRYYDERGMGYRDDHEMWDEDMHERRRRSRMTGRYY